MSLKRSLPVPTTTPEETAATDTRVDTAAFPVEIAHPPPLKKQMLVALSMPTLLPLSPPVDEPVNLAPILTLPNEILQDVIALVAAHSHTDALAFSSTCKTVRIVSKPAIFSRFCLSWPLLDRFIGESAAHSISIMPHITNLHIHDPSSWGEWHKSQDLGDLIHACSSLTALHLSISGSSGWIKYIVSNHDFNFHCSHITKLSVVSRVALENRGHPDNNNLKLPLFDIADLLCFENIKTLELEGFNVRNENIMDEDQDDYKMESRKPMHKQAEITNLKLKNCIWEYPFTVQDFGPIKNLQVVYTDCYRSFTYSERVRNLAQSPPPSIESFDLHLLGRSPISQKAWHPLTDHACTKLRRMSIKGFSMPGDSFFLGLPHSLKHLEIELAMFARHRLSFHTDGQIQRCIERFSGFGVNFTVIIWDDSNSGPNSTA